MQASAALLFPDAPVREQPLAMTGPHVGKIYDVTKTTTLRRRQLPEGWYRLMIGGKARAGRVYLEPLGDHPTLGGVAVKSGRYGAYVTAGGVNATIPSDKTQDTYDAIAKMGKNAIKAFVKGNFNQNIDLRKPEAALRAEAIQLVDRFGIA